MRRIDREAWSFPKEIIEKSPDTQRAGLRLLAAVMTLIRSHIDDCGSDRAAYGEIIAVAVNVAARVVTSGIVPWRAALVQITGDIGHLVGCIEAAKAEEAAAKIDTIGPTKGEA